MPTSIIHQSSNAENVASFRAWGSTFSNMLVSSGLTKTNDSNQINWSTVNLPTPNTIIGFEIFRFNDSLQSVTPIYIKIEYGAKSIYAPLIKILVGSGTNGSGGLIGLDSSFSITLTTATTYDTIEKPSWAAYDGSGLVIVHCANHLNTLGRGLFVIDRLRDLNGVPNSHGFSVFYKTGFDQIFTQRIHNRSDNTVNSTVASSLLPFQLEASLYSYGGSSFRQDTGEIITSPYYTFVPNFGLYVSKMLLCVNGADVNGMSEISILHLNKPRIYKALGSSQGYCDSASQKDASVLTWIGD
jgi:hypothetical protein